jgi:branched-chain amino acid transport system permease protein
MTVAFRATTIVNFGHGDMVMGGAFVVYVLVVLLGLPYFAAAMAGVGLLFLLGAAMWRGLMKPLGTAPHLTFAMMTVAVSYLLRGIARAFWGRDVLPMPTVFSQDPVEISGLFITPQDMVMTGIILALVAIFFLIFQKSQLGRLIQAVFQTERGAALVGINVSGFHNTMWGVGAAMGAIGGILIAPITLLHPDMGAQLLMRGFAAMTLGGFGSLGGAVVGGILMALIEQIAGAYGSTAIIDISAYIVIIIVLIIRPAGLFGRLETIRV